jgi:hypothetical protein
MDVLLFTDQYNTNNKRTLIEEIQWDVVTQILKTKLIASDVSD